MYLPVFKLVKVQVVVLAEVKLEFLLIHGITLICPQLPVQMMNKDLAPGNM